MTLVPRVLGPYTVGQQLGAGGMGLVYAARHGALDRPVALKVRPTQPRSPDEALIAERFRQGAILQASLDHPHIARLHDYFEIPGLQVMVLEMLGGGSLEDRLKGHVALDIAEALAIAERACDAVEYAHQRGIVHRDIKPANLLFTRAGGPEGLRVADFGVAKAEASPDLTVAGASVGTLWYMPPEQFNREAPTPQADVYALGATLYEMLTGHIPFRSAEFPEIFKRFLDREPPPPIRGRNPRVPPVLAAVVEQALALDRSDRTPSAAVLGTLLAAVAVATGLEWDTLAKTGRALAARTAVALLPQPARAEVEAGLDGLGGLAPSTERFIDPAPPTRSTRLDADFEDDDEDETLIGEFLPVNRDD